MMGKKDSQLRLAIVDLQQLIPENHLLKKIDNAIDFNFICTLAQPYLVLCQYSLFLFRVHILQLFLTVQIRRQILR